MELKTLDAPPFSIMSAAFSAIMMIVALRSADPLVQPIIDANYLAEERDRDALRRGVRIARERNRRHPTPRPG